MVEQLRTRVSAEDLPVIMGDMATTQVEGKFTLVFLVFNTIGNLRTQTEQVECFRNAAHHLCPGGRFVVEVGFRRATHKYRYVWPSELDLMAQLAGMELESRHEDWAGTPFGPQSESHVSVWRLPE